MAIFGKSQIPNSVKCAGVRGNLLAVNYSGGVKECYGITRRKVLYIAILGVFLLIFFKTCILAPNSADVKNPYIDACLYYPSHQNYTLRLKPKQDIFPLRKLGSNDYTKLVDLNDFMFNINEPTKCRNKYVLLLVVVTSAAQNFYRRSVIRKTWGQQDIKVQVLFMLGMPLYEETQITVEQEHQLYGDIIQGNFMDTYTNLTYKTMMSLKYVLYHCSNAVYIFKSDDDVFINMPLMKNYLTNDLSPFGALNLLQCIVFTNNTPIRDSSKWGVTEEEFSGSKYPIYCNGAWALFSPDVIFKLYKEAQSTKYLFLEDVFLYGISGSKVAGLKHTDIRNLTLSYKPVVGLVRGFYDNINFLIGTFGMNGIQITQYWNYVINRPVRSSVYDYSEIST